MSEETRTCLRCGATIPKYMGPYCGNCWKAINRGQSTTSGRRSDHYDYRRRRTPL